MTKQELTSVRAVATQIHTLEAKLHGLRLLAANLVPTLDGMPHDTTVKSRVEAVALKTIMAEGELETLRKQLQQAKVNLINQILDDVADPTLQTLLILRYVKIRHYLSLPATLTPKSKAC